MPNRVLIALLTAVTLALAGCQTGVAPPQSADKPTLGYLGSNGSDAP